MKKEKLYEYLIEQLEIESVSSLNENTFFEELDEWDSMGALILISFADEHFNKSLTSSEIMKLTTIGSFIELIGIDEFE